MLHPTSDKITNWPLWWFACLDSALERGDNQAAAEALRKLEYLGIEVRFRFPPGRVLKRAMAAEARQSRDAAREKGGPRYGP